LVKSGIDCRREFIDCIKELVAESIYESLFGGLAELVEYFEDDTV